MKKLYIFLILLLFQRISFSQTGESPYPIIFVHGLNSDDQTWNSMLTRISTAWNLSSSHTLNFVLNARGGDTTDYLLDVIIPYRNVSGTVVNAITNSSIYTINFRNFWNRNSSDPRIILNSDNLPGSNQSSSNESAIYKQGFALKILIDSVLRITGAEKVILLGHSMGGLAIREYLQRKENGVRKWWVEPNDNEGGHKVASFITIGTPHLGTDISIPFSGIDFKSEAIRDMRNSFTASGDDGAYLFGNFETVVPNSYYNKDINCNGSVSDTISGIDSNTTYNSDASLPLNIQYTWILSNYLNFGTDLAVALSSQALYDSVFTPDGVTDTLMTNKNHIQETGDTRTLLRGLDEPDSKDFAYDISLNKLYSGYITLQTNNVASDSDFYKIKNLSAGNLKINLSSLSSGVTNLAILSNTGSILITKNITTSNDSISYSGLAGDYLIRIIGNSNSNPSINNYKYTAFHLPALKLNITLGLEGMQNDSGQIRDTVRIYLRNNNSPFNISDSAVSYSDNFGNATADFLYAQAGNYYIQTIHRNALETWSSAALSFVNGNPVNFDFTVSQSQAFGNNLILNSGKWCFFSGDINADKIIDLTDLIGTYNDAANFTLGYVTTDLTGDNIVSLSDILIAYNNSVKFVIVMTP